jgi:N-acetylmuramoyl-L-alanine amidase
MTPGGAGRPTLNQKIGLGFASSISRGAAFCLAAFELTSLALALIIALTLALALVIVPSMAAQDDIASRRASAQDQFERAEAQRAALEAKAERERSVRDYEDLVSAYRRVYLITPNAAEVPPAIKNVADLYRRMGEQFEASYFQSAIKTYEFLIHDYPASSLREGALLAIAEIRKKNSRSDRTQLDLAQKNYEDFLEQYPHSPNAPQARQALAEIQAAKKANSAPEAAGASPAPARPPSGTTSGTAAGMGAGTGAGTTSTAALPTSAAPSNTAAGGPEPGQGSEVSRVRVWNADNYTRIIIELGGKAKYQAARISDPDRIYFDIENAKLSGTLLHDSIDVPSGGYLKSVRVAQNRSDIVRVVLDVAKVKDYSVFELADPDRLVVDVYGPGTRDGANANSSAKPVADSGARANAKSTARTSAKTAAAPDLTSAARPATAPVSTASMPPAATPTASTRGASMPTASTPTASTPTPSTIRAARTTTAQIPAVGLLPIPARFTASLTPMPVSARLNESLAGSESVKALAEKIGPPPAAKPTRAGERSLTRALGLKIGRIVIDPGHGGHDTGTIGPTGLMEKDLCLDVALRLAKLIEQRVPSEEIVYTRQDDKYVGLERRTAIANEAKADLFVSIHANSSDDASVSGIETYYLNFNGSPQAMEVAARENATAQSSVHDLQDLVTKIAANEKVEESRDLAADIQDSLAASMRVSNRPERNRGVRKAPFVVLVGADMPSVLAEISFISNSADEQLLKKPENRQRAAEGLFNGIERYLRSVNSLSTTISPSASAPRPQ